MISLEQYRQAIGRADLDLTAKGGALLRAKRAANFLGAWLHYAPPSVRTYMTIDK